MDRFFRPRSVAVVGVSRTTGDGSFNIVENLLSYGYPGEVYPVNPNAPAILGIRCYPSVTELPAVPELAIISLPRELVPGAVRDAVALGIKALIVITQGFAEADGDGARLQEEFLAALAGSGARLMGPNTLGTVNIFERFSSSFMRIARTDPLPLGMVCQTGFFLATDLAPSVGLGLAVDVGNAVDISLPECLAYLADDDRTQVLAIHLEGVQDGRRLFEVARGITPRKPILALKTGRSPAGTQAAGSHTGSLTGEDAVYQAAFEQSGILRMDDVEELDDALKAFLRLPPIKGNRIAIVTATGGGGIMAVDACSQYGLELARFSGDTIAFIRTGAPPWFEPQNPLDVWPAAIGRPYVLAFAEMFRKILDDPGVDAVVCVGGAVAATGDQLADFIRLSGEVRPDKPVLWWVQGRESQSTAFAAERDSHVAVYPSPERAMRALARLHRYHCAIKGRPPASGAVSAGAGADPGRVASVLSAAGSGFMGPEAFDLLEACGIGVAPWAVADSPEAVGGIADRIGYPVAIKGLGPDLIHKTERGAVVVDVRSRAGAEQAARAIRDRANAGLTGILVQRYLGGGYEVILGGKQDPQFGPTVLFGAGGVLTELVHDVSIGLAPLSRQEALAMVERTRAFRILSGLRGRPPGDSEAVVDALLRVSQLVARHPEVLELDINPLLVFPRGEGCVAVDARILVQDKGIRPVARMTP
jgi:acetyltransferase